jgi:hypothetical protein
MVSFLSNSRFSLLSAVGASVLVLVAMGVPTRVNAQTPSDETQTAAQSTTTWGLAAGQRLMEEAEQAINAQNYEQAARKLQAARENLNAVSTGYQQLAGVFTGIDGDISSNMRTQALAAAQSRDQATYQQALVYRAQNQPALAVPLLVEVLQSQGPSRDLGQRSYNQLFELGFVALAYPRTGGSAEDSGNSSAVRPLEQSNSPLGIGAGKALIAEADQAMTANNYALAASKLQEARETLNQVSGYYQQLVGVFTGIDRRVVEDVRDRALEAAQLRDQATFQQGLAYRAQNQPDLAVPLFIEILQSQNPTRELGQQSYQQLYEIGFVDLTYPTASE